MFFLNNCRRFGSVVFLYRTAWMALQIIGYKVFVPNTSRMVLGERRDNPKQEDGHPIYGKRIGHNLFRVCCSVFPY